MLKRLSWLRYLQVLAVLIVLWATLAYAYESWEKARRMETFRQAVEEQVMQANCAERLQPILTALGLQDNVVERFPTSPPGSGVEVLIRKEQTVVVPPSVTRVEPLDLRGRPVPAWGVGPGESVASTMGFRILYDCSG